MWAPLRSLCMSTFSFESGTTNRCTEYFETRKPKMESQLDFVFVFNSAGHRGIILLHNQPQ